MVDSMEDFQIEYLRARPIEDALEVIKHRNSQCYFQNEKIEQLEAENERLKEVLGVYADVNNWSESSHLSDYKVFRVGFTGSDGWEIAQEALKGNK